MNYLYEVAALVSIHAEDGTNLLSKQYEKLDFVDKNRAFSSYINPKQNPVKRVGPLIPVFPFGCNKSQFIAVKNALDNQISVIQGPPGTGKTQTILNIIANLLIDGKTVQVVSNNNYATTNVLDKLSEYGMDFLVAPLGNSDNKTRFIQEQNGQYPDILQNWASDISDKSSFLDEIYNVHPWMRYTNVQLN